MRGTVFSGLAGPPRRGRGLPRRPVRNPSPDLLRRRLRRWRRQVPFSRFEGPCEPGIQDGRLEDSRESLLVERQWQVYTPRYAVY